MSTGEWMFLLLGFAAALAVLGPQRKRGNSNPPPTGAKPPAPPAPPAPCGYRPVPKSEGRP